MIKILTKQGNDYVMIFDKPTLDMLHATPETAFEVNVENGSLVLTPVDDCQAEQKFEKAVAMVHERFGNAMKKLAE